MKKRNAIQTRNRDVSVSWIYIWSNQQDMSIHEQRIVLRILEKCQIEALQGVLIKSYTGQDAPKFEHGLCDVDVTMHVSDVIFSNREHGEIIKVLDDLSGRFFTYEDDDVWWKCGFISSPKYQKGSGVITFRVSNDLWNVLTKFSKGYREFELNKALALPTSYAVRFYILLSNQEKPFDITVERLKEWLGIPAEKYKNVKGGDRIDHIEERILKPTKKVLDESCPWTFDYSKKRENQRNIRSRVTGFLIIPKRQLKFRDVALERTELQAKLSASCLIESNVYDYLIQQIGFTREEVNRNKDLFSEAQKVKPDLLYDLSNLKGKSRTVDNPKGYIINALKSMVKEAQKSPHV